MEFSKVDLVRHLAKTLGYSNYLEITTGTTGGAYDKAMESGFATCRRVVYLASNGRDDRLPIDFREEEDRIEPAMAALAADRVPVDIIMVDPHHTYEDSLRDISAAFELVRPGGALVVHDCGPRSAKEASRAPHRDSWCGLTYRAFLDFVFKTPGLIYFTLDRDLGCGVILKHGPGIAGRGTGLTAHEKALRAQWLALDADDDATYAFFDAHRRELLRLIGPRPLVAHFSGRHPMRALGRWSLAARLWHLPFRLARRLGW